MAQRVLKQYPNNLLSVYFLKLSEQCTVLTPTENLLLTVNFIGCSHPLQILFFFLNTQLCVKAVSFMTLVEMFVCDFGVHSASSQFPSESDRCSSANDM